MNSSESVVFDKGQGGVSGWLVTLPVALGLAGGGGAGAWFWLHPFNYSLWHFSAGVAMVGVLVVLGASWALGTARVVARGCTIAVAVALMLTAGASGAMGAVLVVAWLLALAWGVGEGVLRRLGVGEALGLAGRATLAVALGMGALAYGALGLGLAGLLRPATVWGCLLLLTLLFYPAWLRFAGDLREAGRLVRARWAAGGGALAAFLVPASALCLLGAWLWALAPPVWYDELNYQLAAPATYAHLGAVVDRPEEFRFVWAHNANMLYALGIVLGGLTAAKLLHFALGLLAAVTTFALGRGVAGGRTGALAAVLFLALPIVSWELGVAYVDLGVTFFSAAALLAALQVARGGEAKWMALAGLLCGVALGTKLNAGLLVAPLGVVLVVVLWRRRGWRSALLGGGCLAGGSLFALAPWLVRDWAWTGNPVFPYLNDLFASPRWPLDAGLQNFHLYGHRQGVLAAILLPWDLVVHAGAFGEGLGPGVAGALLWLGLPWCAVWGRTAAGRVALLAWAVILPACLATLVVSQYLRYLLPLAVPLAVVAALNLEEAWRWGAAWRPRLAVTVALLLGVVYLGGSRLAHLTMLWPLPGRLPVGVALGLERREEFLARTVREFPAMRHLDGLVGADGKVVGVGCHARLYTHARIFEAAWGRHELWEVSQGGARGEALASALVARGFGALVVDREVVKASGWGSLPVLEESFLKRYASLTFVHRGVEVYRLSTHPLSARSGARNLLANRGFEELGEDGFPRHWFPYGTPGLGPGRGEGRGVLASRDNGLTQPVPAQAGQVYTLSHWTRAEEPGQAARLQINWLDTRGEMVEVSIQVVEASPTWRSHVLAAVAPPRTSTAMVYVSVHEDSRVWFDDLCFLAGTATVGCE